VAQPWTESAPVDFSKFAESSIYGAIKAQEQFATQSKNFSDLLTTNIDNVNKNKNTLQAVELLNGLDLDSSKALFKSGDLVGHISTLLGTNHINFDSDTLKAALIKKQKDIKDNDQANLDADLVKPENVNLLAENPDILKAMRNSVLSTSDIQKSQQKGKVAFTTYIANKLGNDPNNLAKSPLDIKQEILTNYGNVIDETTLEGIQLDSILSKSKENVYNGTIQNWRDNNTLNTSSSKNADGSLVYQFSEKGLDQAKNAAISKGDIELAQKLDTEELYGINYVNENDPHRKKLADQLTRDIATEKAQLESATKEQITRYLPGAEDLAPSLLNEVTNAAAALNIDEYVDKLPVSKSKQNMIKQAYNYFKDKLNVSPSTFNKILLDQGIDMEKYDIDDMDDLLEDIYSKQAIKTVSMYSYTLPSLMADIKSNYTSGISTIDKKYRRNLRHIANTGQYTPLRSEETLGNALRPEVQNAWAERTGQLSTFVDQINASDATNKDMSPYKFNNNFDDMWEYGDKTAAVANSKEATWAASAGAGILTGWLGPNMWKWVRDKFRKTPATGKTGMLARVLTGIAGASAGSLLYEPALNTWYGNERFAYDPAKIGKAVGDIESRFAKGATTQNDIDFITHHSKYGGSLGPDLAKRIAVLKNQLLSLDTAFKVKK
jgi:ribosomal protein S16